MEQDRIRALLEKYDQGETTLEEEALIGNYFNSRTDISEDLVQYKLYFQWSSDIKNMKAPESLKYKISDSISDDREKRTSRIILLRKWSSWAAAAVIILLISVWTIKNGSYRFSPNNGLVDNETFEDPEKAYEQTVQALAFLSNKLNRGQNKASGSIQKLKELEQAIPNN